MPVAALFSGLQMGRDRSFRYWDDGMPWNVCCTHYKESKSSTSDAKESGRSRNRKCMRHKMKGSWQDDPYFYDKFFRLKGSAWKHADAIRGALYNERADRWKYIPATPKKASSLVAPLRSLLNKILEMSDIPPNRRLFLKPNNDTMKSSRYPLPPPDLLLAGVGPALISNPLGRMEAEYSCGLVPVRIMLESEYRRADRHLSAVHANEIFMEQDNRRFVYALIFTESCLRVYLFDPSGAVITPSLDYHSRPRDFCAVIEGIASLDEVQVGFDTSIRLDEASVPRIWTTEPTDDGSTHAVSYRIKSRLFRASRFIGRATCCWLVEPDGEPHKEYVVKDAWIDTSEVQPELEGSLIRHANKKGVVRGLVRLKHETCIQVPGRSEDTTVKNRRIRKNALTTEYGLVQHRVHTRIVMDTYGKPLEKFSNKRELLLAFRDAIQAHRDLFLVAGILHRDVSLGNILIHPGGEEGDRGILIDLDFASRLDDVESGCRGTFKYMSLDLLENKCIKHSYLHDLESFYYVLCWIICEYSGPGDVEGSRLPQTSTPQMLLNWNSKSHSVAAAAKRKYIEGDFDLPVQPWFGEVIRMLAMQLHGFFRRRSVLKFCSRADSSEGPRQDYAEILGHFQCTIDALPAEEDVTPPTSPPPITHSLELEPLPSKPRKRKDMDDVVASEPRPKRVDAKPAPRIPSIAVCRPRRTKAKYRKEPFSKP